MYCTEDIYYKNSHVVSELVAKFLNKALEVDGLCLADCQLHVVGSCVMGTSLCKYSS